MWSGFGGAADVSLAVLAGYAAVTLTAEVTSAALGWRGTVAQVVAFVHGSSIVIRRAATSVMLAVLLGTAVIYTGLGYPVYLLGPAVLIAAYTIGVQWRRRRGLVALAVVGAVTAVLVSVPSTFPGLDSLALFLGLIAAAWFLGIWFGTGRCWRGNTRRGCGSCRWPGRNWRGMR